MDRNKDGHCKKTAQKAEVVHSSVPRFCLLSFPLSLVQVIPLLTHVLVIECLFPGLSPKILSVITVLSPRTCLCFPPVTSLWTEKMIVSHSVALFYSCQ